LGSECHAGAAGARRLLGRGQSRSVGAQQAALIAVAGSHESCIGWRAMKLPEYLQIDGQRVKVVELGTGQQASFWRKLTALAPWLEVEFQPSSAPEARRTELFGSGKHGRMRFIGDVEDQQILALIETLRTLATGRVQWTAADTAARIEALDRGVDIDVYVSPLCPFCATVSAAALRFASASPGISVRILRADICGLPEQVHTLPTVLADDEIVAQGATTEESLIRQIAVYQLAVPPISGVGVRNTRPAAPAPQAKQRRRRSTAA
jgi:hypothetical protein